MVSNNQLVVWIGLDAMQRIYVGGIDRRARVFARSTKRIICQHGFELRVISFMCFAKFWAQSDTSLA